jgi:hypothetical protein
LRYLFKGNTSRGIPQGEYLKGNTSRGIPQGEYLKGNTSRNTSTSSRGSQTIEPWNLVLKVFREVGREEG